MVLKGFRTRYKNRMHKFERKVAIVKRRVCFILELLASLHYVASHVMGIYLITFAISGTLTTSKNLYARQNSEERSKIST